MRQRCPLFILLILALLLSACGSDAEAENATASAVVPFTATSDTCSPQNIKEEADKVHRLMREFDDASAVAGVTQRDQMGEAVTELQRIRRAADDQDVPTCLTKLKQLQIAHMNTVINTLLAFMGNGDQQAINQGIAKSRQQHELYMLELMRVLGLTVVPITPTVPAGQTPAVVTPGTGTAAAPAGLTPLMTASNPGPNPANLRSAPSLDAQSVATLEVGQMVNVFAQSADAQWVLVEVPGKPGQVAWVYVSLVKLSGLQNSLPVANP